MSFGFLQARHAQQGEHDRQGGKARGAHQNITPGVRLDQPVVDRVDLHRRDLLQVLEIIAQAQDKDQEHAQQDIKARLQVVHPHEIGLTRQKIQLADLVLQSGDVNTRVVELLEALDNLCL